MPTRSLQLGLIIFLSQANVYPTAESIWSWPKWLKITGLTSDPLSPAAWEEYEISEQIPPCFVDSNEYEVVYEAMKALSNKTELEIDKILAGLVKSSSSSSSSSLLGERTITQLASWSSRVSHDWKLVVEMEVMLWDLGCHPYNYFSIDKADGFSSLVDSQVTSCYPEISKHFLGENSLDTRVIQRLYPHALSFINVLVGKVWDARHKTLLRYKTTLPVYEAQMDDAWNRATHPEASTINLVSEWLDKCHRYYRRAVELPTLFVGLEKIEGFKRRFKNVLKVVEVDPDADDKPPMKLEGGQSDTEDLIRLPVNVHRHLYRRRDKYRELIGERLLVHEEWIRCGWILADDL